MLSIISTSIMVATRTDAAPAPAQRDEVSWLGLAVHGLLARIGGVHRRIQARRALMRLDDRMLDDIGLTRDAIDAAIAPSRDDGPGFARDVRSGAATLRLAGPRRPNHRG